MAKKRKLERMIHAGSPLGQLILELRLLAALSDFELVGVIFG